MGYSITEEELIEYIPSEIASKICNCIAASIEEHRTKYSELNHRHSARTNASIIHDLMVDNIKQIFPSNNGQIFHVTQRNCFQLVITQDDVTGKVSIVRFKKFDKNKIAHNNIKQQRLQMEGQLGLLGEETSLNAGYMIRGLDVSFLITKPYDKNNNEWDCELTFDPINNITNISAFSGDEFELPERMPKTKGTEMEENAVKI